MKPMTSEQMLENFRLALAYLRAARANDSELAGTILNQFPTQQDKEWGLTFLLCYIADGVQDIDTILFELTTMAAMDDGLNWLIKPDEA
jgi:hypothetical protein